MEMETQETAQLIYSANDKPSRHDYRTWPILRIPLSIHGVDEGHIDVFFFNETSFSYTEAMSRAIQSDGVILVHGPVCNGTLRVRPVSKHTLVLSCHECALRITTSVEDTKTINDLQNYLRICYGGGR